METLTKQEVVIKTENLKDLVGKAVKVCSMMDGFPLTSMLQLKVKDGKMSIYSTDNVNIMKLEKLVDSQNELDIVVDGKLFSSLISKITTPLTTISVEGNMVIVSANGKYELSLISEDDGSKVNLPEIEFNTSVSSNHISAIELRGCF